MSARTTPAIAWHSIREASLLSGLSESTLRYYEQIGIIPPVLRDPSSGHRIYGDRDIDTLQAIACLNAVGMPLESMRRYLANAGVHPDENDPEAVRDRAARQIELLDAQALRLSEKLERIKIQQAYCSLKTMYWNAIGEGRDEDAQRILDDNRDIIERVRRNAG